MDFVDFSKAKWIWAGDHKTPDQKLVVRRRFLVESVPETVFAHIACDTKFWLWINGKPVVYEGGVFRESVKGCGYAEKVDISGYLQEGENVLAALVWFYGNGGRNNVNSGEAGFIFSCEELALYSDSTFLVMNHPAYVKTGEPQPSYLYGGHNVGFSAALDFGDFTRPDFDDSGFQNATEYPNNAWGECVLSPLPPLKVFTQKESAFELTPTGAVARLPHAMTASIGFVAEAAGGEVIDIRTDRYTVVGGPWDPNVYRSHRIEYTAVKGRNEYTCPMYLYGESVILTFPPTVRLISLFYTENGYNTEQLGSFVTDNALFNRLIEKSIRTLYVCMRNNFMDCPDRERGQWIGDVSVQAPQVFFVYDDKAGALLKKAILDFIHLRKGDVLVGNVPGEHSCELPGQSLVAISEYGLLGEYYAYTLDRDVLETAFEPAVSYLKLWGMEANGLVSPREGDWRWFDHLLNVDETVLENCSYLAAAQYALKMGNILDRHQHDAFLRDRIDRITAAIERELWKGNSYSSGQVVDDRANALAVLCGVCPKDRYPLIRRVLLSVFHATPYMERFVLKALCEMGYVKDAYDRMMSRYYNLASNENSTLWEDFFWLGTKNHAWSGSPLEIAYRYILGLRTEDGFKTYSVHPATGIFREIKATFPAADHPVEVHVKDGTVEIHEAHLHQ